MADSFITRNGNNGFWIAESFMQLVMHYIYMEAQKTQYSFTNKSELLEDLEDNINGLCHGYLGLSWQNYFNGGSDDQTMIQILQTVKTNLQIKGANISVQELLSIPTQDDALKYILDKKPFPTAELIRVIDALIQMLEGTWTSTNYDMDLKWRYFD